MAAPLPLPALHATHAGIWLADGDGEVREASRGEAIARAAETPHIILNAPLVGQRLGYPDLSGLDLLELFAFIHPARFAVPTVGGAEPGARARAAGERGRGGGGAAARSPSALLATLGDRGLARARGRVDVECDAAPARLGLGAADRRAAGAARARRADAVLAPAAMGGGGRAAAAADGLVDPGGDARSELDRADRRGAEPREGQRAMAEAVDRGLRAAPREGRAQHAARRGGDRDRQDARLSRAGVAVGGAVAAARCGSRPSPRRCSGSSTPKGARLFADAEERARRIVVRKGRENYLCLLNLEDALQGAFAGRAAILAQLVGRWAAYTKDGDMVGGDLPGWLPSLFRRAGRDGADRPARRMRLCRLPALPPLLHRAGRAGRPRGRHRHRQPCAGDGQRRARAARTRRRGSCSTRAIICSTPPIRPSRSRSAGRKRSSCGAGSSGPEGRSRGRRRGLAARLMDVASYDEEGGAGARRGGRGGAGAAVRRLAAAAGRRRRRSGRSRRCSPRCAARSTRGPRRRRRATGSRPSWPSRTARWSSAAAAALEALEALHKPLAALGRRLEAVLEDAPDWLDCAGAGAGRRRDPRARLAARDAGGVDRPARRGSAATADPEFVDWLAVERVEGREYDVGHPPPLARPDQAAGARRCWSRRTACW